VIEKQPQTEQTLIEKPQSDLHSSFPEKPQQTSGNTQQKPN